MALRLPSLTMSHPHKAGNGLIVSNWRGLELAGDSQLCSGPSAASISPGSWPGSQFLLLFCVNCKL